ncbi:MAG: hypothetical protein JWL82_436 [Parcubacteria group bacterium]|nr:hypothetical protein [Parcubacteria group bacterium]
MIVVQYLILGLAESIRAAGYYRYMEKFGLNEKELALFSRLSTPSKIQDFLDTLAVNHEKREESCHSPRRVLEERKAHCMEAALVAATALWLHGEAPLLMELRAAPGDQDHAVALYKRNGYWGAVSKTNHVSLRFRDPVYKTMRELALSYFHEYFLNVNGAKTLRAYTRPFSLKRFGTKWMTSDTGVWPIAYALHDAPHYSLLPEENKKFVRPADRIERRAGRIIEWTRSDPRT